MNRGDRFKNYFRRTTPDPTLPRDVPVLAYQHNEPLKEEELTETERLDIVRVQKLLAILEENSEWFATHVKPVWETLQQQLKAQGDLVGQEGVIEMAPQILESRRKLNEALDKKILEENTLGEFFEWRLSREFKFFNEQVLKQFLEKLQLSAGADYHISTESQNRIKHYEERLNNLKQRLEAYRTILTKGRKGRGLMAKVQDILPRRKKD